MNSNRTNAIFFDDLTKQAQKRIIAVELEQTLDMEVSHVVVKDYNSEPYGYDPDPKKQEMLQDIHVKARYNHHDHHWLLVWDCMEAEFITITEENQ